MSTKVSTDLINLSGNTGGLVWAKGTTAQQPGSATAGDMRVDTTANTTLVYNGTGWKTLKETAIALPPIPTHFLVLAGGGGGGGAGGAGAGGLLTTYATAPSTSSGNQSQIDLSLSTAYTITVGIGGPGSGTAYAPIGGAGANSSISGSFTGSPITAAGGGAGGASSGSNGGNGGSGGGSGWSTSGGTATPSGQGFDGGTGVAAPNYSGGGGGGASETPISPTQSVAGAGGEGVDVSITGSVVDYAGGGGAAGYTSAIGFGAAPTKGGGGAGFNWGGSTTSTPTPNPGTYGKGGGGGSGGNGGSGAVILRYPTTDLPYFTTTGTLNTPSTADTVADTAYPVANTAYYKLDSNANDSAPSGYIGQGGIFNGSSSKVSTTYFITGSPQSFSFWVKVPSGSTRRHLCGDFNTSALNGRFLIELDASNQIYIYVGNSAGTLWTGWSPQSFTSYLNSWTNLIVIVDGTQIKLYLNGSLISTQTSSLTMAAGANGLTLGGFGQGTLLWNGSIDQVRIYNTALSASNVALLYAETSATSSTLNYPVGAGGMALYEFSGNANDTGGAYNGTATNVLYAYNGTPSSSSYLEGRFGSSFNCANTRYINVSSLPELSATRTISLWVNPYSIDNNDRLFGSVQGSNYFNISFGGSNNIAAYTGGVIINSSSNSLSTTIWQNIILVANGTLAKLYINGVEAASVTITSHTLNPTSAYIGTNTANPGVQIPNALIDQVRIFSSALTPGDVEDLYNEHFPTKFIDGSDTALKFTGGTGDITFFDSAADYLVVAGGGGGGGGITGDVGGSGGAGSVIYQATKLDTSKQYTLNIGLGGVGGGGNSRGVNGTDTYIQLLSSDIVRAKGGGGGGSQAGPGKAGGSGGGGTRDGDSNSSQAGGSAVSTNVAFGGASIYGNNGGTGNGTNSGSGGGAGTIGIAGNGGDGVQINIDGNNYYWGGGAGAAGTTGANGGLGGGAGGPRLGLGGGSAINTGATATNDNGSIGGANTGGGGSGGINSGNSGGAGGSGIVILRYPNTKTITVGAGLTATTATVGTDSVTTFTAGTGTISFS